MTRSAAARFAVDSDDVTLVGDVWTADPVRGTAILLHGGGQTRQSWGPAAAVLADRGWTSVTFDARGHGESGWSPTASYGVDDRVRDLRAVVRTVADELPVLIGASMGGVTSLLAAGEDPVFARALVLVDVVPRIEAAGVERVSAFLTARPDGFASLGEAAAAVRDYSSHRTRPVNEAGLRKNLRERADGRWYWHWDPAWLTGGRQVDERAQRVERLRDAAATLQIPTLLVRGTESDVVGDDGVADLLSLNPDIQVRDVPGTGHMIAGDDNTAFGQALLTFLDDLAVSRPPDGRG
jgi:pimeloyl-ACP methyl ester carboxylesterase